MLSCPGYSRHGLCHASAVPTVTSAAPAASRVFPIRLTLTIIVRALKRALSLSSPRSQDLILGIRFRLTRVVDPALTGRAGNADGMLTVANDPERRDSKCGRVEDERGY